MDSAATSPHAIDIPVPAPTGSCWAATAARLEAQSRRMEELGCAVHQAMDLPQPTSPLTETERLRNARSEGFDEGSRYGAKRRSWWDIFCGMVWGALLMLLLLGASATAGWLSVKLGLTPIETHGTVEAPAEATQGPAPRPLVTWADQA